MNKEVGDKELNKFVKEMRKLTLKNRAIDVKMYKSIGYDLPKEYENPYKYKIEYGLGIDNSRERPKKINKKLIKEIDSLKKKKDKQYLTIFKEREEKKILNEQIKILKKELKQKEKQEQKRLKKIQNEEEKKIKQKEKEEQKIIENENKRIINEKLKKFVANIEEIDDIEDIAKLTIDSITIDDLFMNDDKKTKKGD